jgi:hypothetical protein
MVTYKVVFRAASGALVSRFVVGGYAVLTLKKVVRDSGATLISVRPVVNA